MTGPASLKKIDTEGSEESERTEGGRSCAVSVTSVASARSVSKLLSAGLRLPVRSGASAGLLIPESGSLKADPESRSRNHAISAAVYDSNRVDSLRKNSSTMPVGPFRCLPMISSAFPTTFCSWASRSDR